MNFSSVIEWQVETTKGEHIFSCSLALLRQRNDSASVHLTQSNSDVNKNLFARFAVI